VPKCNHHNRISARERLDCLLDDEGRYEIGYEVTPVDSLKFRDSRRYTERLDEARKETGEEDALIVVQGSVKTIPLIVAAFEFRFLGGSMGSAVGERFIRGVQACVEQRLPFVCFSASGGRAHAGRPVFPAANVENVRRPHAAFQGQAAIHFGAHRSDDGRCIGELRAYWRHGARGAGRLDRICRAARDRADNARNAAEGFQRSEFLLQHGAIDLIVDRREMRDKLANLITLFLNLPQPTAN
jgi:acetyl-CoA carboxylase carboxyl transferase subunit beta